MLVPRVAQSQAVVAFRWKKLPEKPSAWRRTQLESEILAMDAIKGDAMAAPP
jgi:hypothetical protein